MGYTLRYKKTYDEWVDEKARRIQSALRFFYLRELPIDFQRLAFKVYRERLTGIGKWRWKPIDNRFLNFKPSPFIINFIKYLVSELVDGGYVVSGWVVELRDRVRVKEGLVESSVARIYRVGVFRRIVEVSDKVGVSDVKAEYQLTPLKVTVWTTKLGTRIATVEVRDITRVNDEPKPVETRVYVAPPKIKSVRKVLRVPSLNVLKEICRWTDPDIEKLYQKALEQEMESP